MKFFQESGWHSPAGYVVSGVLSFSDAIYSPKRFEVSDPITVSELFLNILLLNKWDTLSVELCNAIAYHLIDAKRQAPFQASLAAGTVFAISGGVKSHTKTPLRLCKAYSFSPGTGTLFVSYSTVSAT